MSKEQFKNQAIYRSTISPESSTANILGQSCRAVSPELVSWWFLTDKVAGFLV